MATAQTTKQDIDNMTDKERLWTDLINKHNEYVDDNKRASSKQISQTEYNSMAKGMNRSPYTEQLKNNIAAEYERLNQKNYQDTLAKYASGVNTLEQQAKENEWREREFEANRADAAWNQNFQQSQFDWQKQNQQQQFDYQKSRDAVSDAQWREQFDYSKLTTDQQYYMSWLQNIASNGGTPSDEILAKAGLSRADYNAVLKQIAASGGGSYRPKTNGDTSGETPPTSLPNWYNENFGGTNSTSSSPIDIAAVLKWNQEKQIFSAANQAGKQRARELENQYR